MLPQNPGPSGWKEILPARQPQPELGEKITADLVIIGAGFAGLSAAYHAHQLDAKLRIVVLEAQDLAEGPAGRNSGFMIDLPHDLTSHDYGGTKGTDQARIAKNRRAIRFASKIAADFDIPPDCFDPVGKVNAAVGARGHAINQSYLQHLEALGEPAEHLDAQAMRALTGIAHYSSGLFTPGTVMIQPAAYIRALGNGLVQRGIMLFENSPVTALMRDGDWMAKTPKGAVTAPRVILAVNGFANAFGAFENRLLHVFTYASLSAPLGPDAAKRLGGQPRWGLTPADPMGTSLRRIQSAQGPRLLVRNRFTFDPSLRVSEAKLARMAKTHRASFEARFGHLGAVKMDYVWGGALCVSRNDAAAFGQIQEGLISACCQNGLGTVQGTFNGMMAAELALDQRSEMLDAHLQEPGPKRLPPKMLTLAGARARITWEEWRARGEL